MQHERVSDLVGRSHVVSIGSGARILHISFVGKHHYTHGAQMASQLKAAVAAERPDGVLVDLLEYEYEFGNDVCGLFIAGYINESRTLVRTCIVAAGKTRTSMENLYTAGHFKLDSHLAFVGTVSEGLGWLST